ncbi:hypothetical protein PV328_000729 [Microctonus aethiopoides]|uniref:Uncharacterized protein n=1 Tax=Microctonus aethiopoides TaxID=144406 RepID=A0AA39FW40_9HYME|nr:hypothetical protein PV328_000729 [Microctonus aethiopoides]
MPFRDFEIPTEVWCCQHVAQDAKSLKGESTKFLTSYLLSVANLCPRLIVPSLSRDISPINFTPVDSDKLQRQQFTSNRSNMDTFMNLVSAISSEPNPISADFVDILPVEISQMIPFGHPFIVEC